MYFQPSHCVYMLFHKENTNSNVKHQIDIDMSNHDHLNKTKNGAKIR